jgi:mannose-6-phosphate isomerase-like protein (cupin superfamily)
MLVRDLKNCPEFLSGDNAILRELFNPAKEDIAPRYSLAHARVKPGQRTRWHRLKTCEVYYILEGEGEMQIGEEVENVRPGQAIVIPRDSPQRIRNTGKTDLVFLCVVDPAWHPEDEEILE